MEVKGQGWFLKMLVETQQSVLRIRHGHTNVFEGVTGRGLEGVFMTSDVCF